MAKTKKTFRVEIEAKIDVEAFDEASAKKKVEKLLGSRRELGADVEATGDIWTYAAPMVSGPRKAPATSPDTASCHAPRPAVTGPGAFHRLPRRALRRLTWAGADVQQGSTVAVSCSTDCSTGFRPPGRRMEGAHDEGVRGTAPRPLVRRDLRGARPRDRPGTKDMASSRHRAR